MASRAARNGSACANKSIVSWPHSCAGRIRSRLNASGINFIAIQPRAQTGMWSSAVSAIDIALWISKANTIESRSGACSPAHRIRCKLTSQQYGTNRGVPQAAAVSLRVLALDPQSGAWAAPATPARELGVAFVAFSPVGRGSRQAGRQDPSRYGAGDMRAPAMPRSSRARPLQRQPAPLYDRFAAPRRRGRLHPGPAAAWPAHGQETRSSSRFPGRRTSTTWSRTPPPPGSRFRPTVGPRRRHGERRNRRRTAVRAGQCRVRGRHRAGHAVGKLRPSEARPGHRQEFSERNRIRSLSVCGLVSPLRNKSVIEGA